MCNYTLDKIQYPKDNIANNIEFNIIVSNKIYINELMDPIDIRSLLNAKQHQSI